MRSLVLVLGAALLLGACSDADTGEGECLSAFRAVDPRAEPPFETSPLDDAIRRCDSLESWREAWRRVPEARPAEVDPDEFLRERCSVVALSATALCREALNAS